MLSPRGVGCILPRANQKAPEPFGGCLLGRLRLILNAHPHTSVAAVPTRAGEPGGRAPLRAEPPARTES
jgi:hypothetical protein